MYCRHFCTCCKMYFLEFVEEHRNPYIVRLYYCPQEDGKLAHPAHYNPPPPPLTEFLNFVAKQYQEYDHKHKEIGTTAQ